MKVGSVLGLHIVAVCAFALSQGCVTSESQGSGRGAGARRKGPWKHEHKGKAAPQQVVAQQNAYPQDSVQGSVYEPVIIESASTTAAPAPYVAPVVVPPPSNSDTYIVQKGDMLSKIAVRFDTTTKTLVSMNNLSNPDVLYVGQELRVPAGSRSSSSPGSYSAKSKPSVKKGGSYVIQKGDTLSGIAAAAGVSLADLRSLNNIQDDKIFAGETISIPSGGKVPAKKHKTAPEKAEPVDEVAEPAPAPMAAVDPEAGNSMEVDAVMDHVVYPGETLDDISRQYGVGKSEIMRLNNISDETAIKENQRLRIPIAE